MPVPAFSSAPMPSKIWSISSELYLAVPLNSRCSSRCESPAWSSDSSREPVPIQNPSDTDRTEGIASVTIRTPESSVVSRCSWATAAGRRGDRRGAALGVAVAHAVTADRGPRSRVAVAVAVARAPRSRSRSRSAAASVAAATVAAAPAVVAAADRRQLLDGLAGDLGIVGEPQADPAALAVDLDHPHGELVALVEHLLDRRDPAPGRDVGDVQQAVGALGELDERAERGRLDDLAGELVADLDLLGHRADPVDQRVAELPVGRVDEHLALVVDVDLGLELLLQRADRLAALADQQADLLGVDLDRRDPRGVLGQLRRAARR